MIDIIGKGIDLNNCMFLSNFFSILFVNNITFICMILMIYTLAP